MNLNNVLYSFLVIFSPLIVNFGQIFGHFWPPLWPKVPKRSLYEAGPLALFFGCWFSQKTNLSNGLFAFLVIISPLIVDFMPILAKIWLLWTILRYLEMSKYVLSHYSANLECETFSGGHNVSFHRVLF